MSGSRLSAAVRLHYLRHLFGQSAHVLDTLPPGHAVGTITATSDTLQLGISEKLGTFVECASLIVTALIVALTWNRELALVTSAGFVVIVLVVGTLFPLTVKGQTRQANLESQAATIASEAFGSIRMVMACGAQHQMVTKYSTLIEEAKRQARATSPLTSLQFSLTVSAKSGIPMFSIETNGAEVAVLRCFRDRRSDLLVWHPYLYQESTGQYRSHHRVSIITCPKPRS